jgi:cytochrome P450
MVVSRCIISVAGLTHDEVLAQSILFLLAGYDTTATTLSFVGYSLAVNPECQDKLIAEIDNLMQGQVCDGQQQKLSEKFSASSKICRIQNE